ncbi:methyl-accepting chemotaxis protein [Agrobacterium sp. CG674]
MSFLKKAKIRTKILSFVTAVSLTGLIGVGAVALNYKGADTDYANFIAKDVVASTDLIRANTAIVSIGYAATLGLVLLEQSADTTKLEQTYKSDIALVLKRMEDVKQRLPAVKSEAESLISRVGPIGEAGDKVWKAAKAGDFQTARKHLTEVGPLIAQWRVDLRTLTDSNLKTVGEKTAALAAQTNSTILTSISTLGVLFIVAIFGALFVSARGITRPIEQLRERMVSLAAGETKEEVAGLDRGDEIGHMARAVAVFRTNAMERQRLEDETEANRSRSEKERIAHEQQKAKEAADTSFAVENLAAALARLSDGDVAYRINQPFAEHLDVVRSNFNASAVKLQSALSRVADNARAIDAGANEIRAAADDLAKRTEQQAASVEETAAALEQITTTVHDSTKRAQEAGHLVANARSGAEQSGVVVRKAVVAMEQIEKSSSEISNIISVIDEIAFQTNLLALNAGVEAARAGEAGKGFAVVAQEVRELAQRSANAAKDIKALINTSNTQVQQGVQLVGETGRALENIVAEVQEINRHVVAIVDAAQEQSSGLAQINGAVNQMDQDTQKNAAMVEEQTAASHGLAREAASLNDLLGQFKLQGGSTEAPVRMVTQTERPVQSPARALSRKVATAFNGNAAVKSEWEEF